MGFRLPGQVITQRLLIRPVHNDRDFALMADFFNACDQDYPRRHFKWPKYAEPYEKRGMLELTRYMMQGGKNSDHYLFSKGNTHIIGCMNYSTDRTGSPRIAYYVHQEFRRQGLASEAHKASLKAFLKANSSLKGLWEEVSVNNPSSRRVLIKSGFRKMGSRHSSHFGATVQRIDSFYCSRESGLA